MSAVKEELRYMGAQVAKIVELSIQWFFRATCGLQFETLALELVVHYGH